MRKCDMGFAIRNSHHLECFSSLLCGLCLQRPLLVLVQYTSTARRHKPLPDICSWWLSQALETYQISSIQAADNPNRKHWPSPIFRKIATADERLRLVCCQTASGQPRHGKRTAGIVITFPIAFTIIPCAQRANKLLECIVHDIT